MWFHCCAHNYIIGVYPEDVVLIYGIVNFLGGWGGEGQRDFSEYILMAQYCNDVFHVRRHIGFLLKWGMNHLLIYLSC